MSSPAAISLATVLPSQQIGPKWASAVTVQRSNALVSIIEFTYVLNRSLQEPRSIFLPLDPSLASHVFSRLKREKLQIL